MTPELVPVLIYLSKFRYFYIIYHENSSAKCIKTDSRLRCFLYNQSHKRDLNFETIFSESLDVEGEQQLPPVDANQLPQEWFVPK